MGKLSRWLLLLAVIFMATTIHSQKSPRAHGAFMSTESPEYRDLLRDVEEKHIGSFAIETQGSPLGIDRSQVYPTAILVNTLQSHAKVPLLVAADFERGTSMRVEEGASFPHNMAVAATGNPE